METTNKNGSALTEIRRQKAEILEKIHQEQYNIRTYSSELFHPLLRQKRKGRGTFIQNAGGILSTFGYGFRLAKGLFSVFKMFH